MEHGNSPNIKNILVKLNLTDDYIALRTYDRVHGGRGRFLIVRDRFAAWLKNTADETFYSTDCAHVLIARRNRENIHFKVLWLSSGIDPEVHGFIQHFDVPVERLMALIEDRVTIRLVQHENGETARISCKFAGQTIRNIRQDKRKSRAFLKAMRDCFHWKGDVVTLYPDGVNDFYFCADGGWNICGGLVLHETTVTTHRRQFQRVYYSVHT